MYFQLNGIATQGENIADNGGLLISFMAYQKWLSGQDNHDLLLPGLNMTSEQQFFLSFAQVIYNLELCTWNTPWMLMIWMHQDEELYLYTSILNGVESTLFRNDVQKL